MKVTDLHPSKPLLKTGSHRAKVHSAVQGEAVSISVEDSQYNVDGHSSTVPYLDEGDSVLVEVNNAGIFLTHKLRISHERPVNYFQKCEGGWVFDAAESVTLKVGQVELVLEPNGTIELKGHDIYADAKGVYKVQGQRIELN